MINLVNEQVQHRRYGIGSIIEQTPSLVTVQFCEQYGIKKFLYPVAFEAHLICCNSALQESPINELRQIREQEKAKRKCLAKEDEKRREEERRILLEQKRAAAKKRTSAKKATSKVKKQDEKSEET